MKRILSCLMLFVLLGALVDGCESDSDRVARVSQDAAARQAEQNKEMARLVESQQGLQQGIETQHQHLDDERSALDAERRAIATERVRDPIIANALIAAAMLVACALPIVLCFFVLRTVHRPEADAALGELLIQELASDDSVLLPQPNLPASERPTPADKPALGIAGDGES